MKRGQIIWRKAKKQLYFLDRGLIRFNMSKVKVNASKLGKGKGAERRTKASWIEDQHEGEYLFWKYTSCEMETCDLNVAFLYKELLKA